MSFEFDESPGLAYDAGLRAREEVERRIIMLLQQIASGCEVWQVVAALEAILEEVL